MRDDIHGFLVNEAVTGDVNSGPRGPGPVPWPAFVPAGAAPRKHAQESLRGGGGGGGPGGTVLVVNELEQYSMVDSWQEEFCAQWLQLVP